MPDKKVTVNRNVENKSADERMEKNICSKSYVVVRGNAKAGKQIIIVDKTAVSFGLCTILHGMGQ